VLTSALWLHENKVAFGSQATWDRTVWFSSYLG
jgi:hypothetical protein